MSSGGSVQILVLIIMQPTHPRVLVVPLQIASSLNLTISIASEFILRRQQDLKDTQTIGMQPQTAYNHIISRESHVSNAYMHGDK